MFDLIIIGGSAAATAAGIYAARRGLKFKIITKDFGGEVSTSGEIGNWPGDGMTDGITLAGKFKSHLDFYKADMEDGIEVESVSRMEDGNFCVKAKKDSPTKMASEKMPDGEGQAYKCDYTARTVIVATGVHSRELNIPGEKEFRLKGVSYCTTCDGPIFKGRITVVIGGGNSALEAALMLADICPKVYVLNINPGFGGDRVLMDNLKSKPNAEVIYEADTKEIWGDKFVTGLRYDKNGSSHELKVDGIFIHIGMIPNSGVVPAGVKKNSFGEIEVNAVGETNIPGLYAAGDVTNIPFKQIVISAGQGCTALLSAVGYLNKIKS
ncbi:MAG: hypothetical protein A3B99_01675 [Candidatus Yanofskybacteria bacterium RIFCSPHIGHO2_02_FULL_44_12b]|uniref:FAD/NAD(P)-binding domain-containing protein n=2 Tax=Candidatus Yanofskyibacteriota TaxID=1752733 RepID=A0A1F8GLI3_9BACT|nr:MAG: Alkyl hydroperoxide reductase subunit F [Candidatus Yanofskybacteria bacterium GW2011_GWA2_44_9]OGN05335.1 MAG: hypothetical protein A2659_01895 [Candidatus Yanofskybacteria bacterium RIFCSPHIGHO2_01_FULL_44_24]OGN15524.1 MAG: hypothetical protein A3B99_01675 [Candidatus Yanofskybacteria bacterium RIFCSPHIGHO2_02_FULL_44_12b]OGN25526.1 MAG: hypothetical protein A2925_02250 [Candidatus Yanofskybacteria bacterium RIFCSPLOWO2_01_FULL_44_22]